MNAKVITNTKLALILYRFNLDKFKPIWKQKAKVVCKHTQRMRIMWERICENEATLPLFDEDYTFDNPLELFKPVATLTSQTNEVRLCDKPHPFDPALKPHFVGYLYFYLLLTA